MRGATGALAVEGWEDACTISSAGTLTTDAYGGHSSTPEDAYTSIPCRYEPLSSYERATAERIESGADYRLTLPYVWEGQVVTIGPDYTVTVAERDINPERVFKVKGLPRYSSGGSILEVDAQLEA
jgi:hypothetical protein